jgi:hypothetical protein
MIARKRGSYKNINILVRELESKLYYIQINVDADNLSREQRGVYSNRDYAEELQIYFGVR